MVIPKRFIRLMRDIVDSEIFNIENLYVYGSVVRGETRDVSNLDLLYLQDPNLDKKSLRSIKWEIEEQLEVIESKHGIEVKLFIYNYKDFIEYSKVGNYEKNVASHMRKIGELINDEGRSTGMSKSNSF